MLVRLFGSNFRSLKEPFELSLMAADLSAATDCDRGVIAVPIRGSAEPLLLLRTAAIFGPNASGKSTVLTAARALRWLATDSSKGLTPENAIPPYEPFLLDENLMSSPIHLGCDVIHDKTILRYELTYNKTSIISESLLQISGDEETLLIDRNESASIGGHLVTTSNANQLYVTEMQPNVTVLSKLAQHGPHKGPESARPFHSTIRNALEHRGYSHSATMPLGAEASRDRFADDEKYRDWIMTHLIAAADVGICGVNAKREPFELPEPLQALLKQMASTSGDFQFPDKAINISFIHSGQSTRPISFEDESSGTHKLLNISDDWWRLSHSSITLFADELGASLHPRLVDKLVRSANNAPPNSTSQLIFTTHETGLLEGQDGMPPALRRDQVYFTKKNSLGASELYSLTEFKDDARSVHNIRKRYMSGLYGAIPSVEDVSL